MLHHLGQNFEQSTSARSSDAAPNPTSPTLSATELFNHHQWDHQKGHLLLW